MNTYLDARPTTNMKKGWLCRTSCDEKNQEITPMMMTNDDPDPDKDDLKMKMTITR